MIFEKGIFDQKTLMNSLSFTSIRNGCELVYMFVPTVDDNKKPSHFLMGHLLTIYHGCTGTPISSNGFHYHGGTQMVLATPT